MASVAITVATTLRHVSDIVQVPATALVADLVMAAATTWIIRERMIKARDEGV